MGNSDVIAVQSIFSGAEAVSLLSPLHILNTIRHKEATGKAPHPEAQVPGRLLPLSPISRPCWCHHAESKRPNGNYAASIFLTISAVISLVFAEPPMS